MPSRFRWYRFALAFLLISTLAIFARAMTVIIPSDDDLIIGARLIVSGEVTASESSFDDSNTQVFTYTTLRVSEVLKGSLSSEEIVIKELGGDVGGRGV